MRRLFYYKFILVVISAFVLISCGNDDYKKEGNEDAEVNDKMPNRSQLKGIWTTVGCSNIPSSFTEDELANISFRIWYDTFNGGAYIFESQDIPEIDDFDELKDGELKGHNGETIIKILSYNKSQIIVQVPSLSNAILTMKKLGTLDDNDYKYKLCHGIWLVGNMEDSRYSSYLPISNGTDIFEILKEFDDSSVLFAFHKNGTGKYTYKDVISQHEYMFKWELLKNKTLSITTSEGKTETVQIPLYYHYEVFFLNLNMLYL